MERVNLLSPFYFSNKKLILFVSKAKDTNKCPNELTNRNKYLYNTYKYQKGGNICKTKYLIKQIIT